MAMDMSHFEPTEQIDADPPQFTYPSLDEPSRPEVIDATSVPWPSPRDSDPDARAERASSVARANRRAAHHQRRWVGLPLALFAATWISTLLAGGFLDGWATAASEGLWAGLTAGLAAGAWFAVPVMTILICHEMGHFLQARRWGVYASYPFFIPMPLSPFGTLGAVIAMEPRMGNRRALFDIGVTGPLAGLVPTLIFTAVGLSWSEYEVLPPEGVGLLYGDPPLFRFIAHLVLGPQPTGTGIVFHPMAFAGWVGLFITALNLIPIGQLDGGHVLYALLRKKAHVVASGLLLGATAMVVLFFEQYHMWLVMIMLLVAIGPNHPPTSNDETPLGWPRAVLGWLTLALILVGFTPTPIIVR